MTQTIENLQSLTNQQLRQRRVNIYRSKIKHTQVIPSINGKRLTPAKFDMPTANFRKFVDIYFYKIKNPGAAVPMSDFYQYPTRLTTSSEGYRAFENFAKTDYGSSVVKEILGHPEKYSGFNIRQGATTSASGFYKGINLPRRFPYRKYFSTSKQKVYSLAIIYHEFTHTMVFLPDSRKNIKATIKDERIAVLKFENAVRIRKGYEPRYTYTGTSPRETINIITGKVKTGNWLAHILNPAILVKPNHKDALK